jgi:hypothetical protein
MAISARGKGISKGGGLRVSDGGGKYLLLGFPRVICCGIPPPPYQVLKLASFPKEAMPHDCLDLVFFCSVDHFRGRSAEVAPMFLCFMIRGQEGGMEYVMDGPGRGNI